MSKRNIQFITQDEPSFIKNFKAKVGYKEPTGIEAKHEHHQFADDDHDDEECVEEQPTVVVLKKGDLTAEEANEIKKSLDAKAEEETGGRIMFRKPVKRAADDEVSKTTSAASTVKKIAKTDATTPTDKKTSDKDKVKKTSLLSFDQDDEEADDDS